MTIHFGTESQRKLSQAHPDLQKLFNRVNESYQCTILSGSRTVAEQAEFVKKGLSKTMKSKHLVQPDGYCYALDVAPDPVNFERPGYKLDLIYFAGYVMRLAEEMFERGEILSRIRYGGDWNRNDQISDESFQDTDHFEIDA